MKYESILKYKFLLAALFLEFYAFVLIVRLGESMTVMVEYLLLHTSASFFAAIGTQVFLPEDYRHPRRWVTRFLFCYNFFMPIVGLLSVFVGILVGSRYPISFREVKFLTKKLPNYTTHRNHEGSGFRSGRVRSQLSNQDTPLEQRINALMSLEETPARITADLLRGLLSDSSEDLRLLAYGILDGKEKAIAHRIQQTIGSIESLTTDELRYAAHKRLAELYFELVYQKLVQGDMRIFCIDQVRKNVQLAHGFQPDAGLWFMLARLELTQGNTDAAEEALLRAGTENFTRQRLLPYLAELRFLQRRFANVRTLFEEDGMACLPALLPLAHYWSGGQIAAETNMVKTLVLDEMPSPVSDHV